MYIPFLRPEKISPNSLAAIRPLINKELKKISILSDTYETFAPKITLTSSLNSMFSAFRHLDKSSLDLALIMPPFLKKFYGN